LKKQIPADGGKARTDLNSSVLNSNTKDKGLAATGTVVAGNAIDNHPAPAAESAQGTKSPAAATVTSATAATVATASAAITTPAATSAETKQIHTDSVSNNLVQEEKAKNKSDSNAVTKKTNSNKKINQGFYIGLIAGPDVSTVKFQSVNNLGFSLGALVGYHFNNRISVETGLIWDKKYYYSNGEYYKKNGISLPPTTTLDGSCSMFEIPVSIRFDFATKKNYGFFAKTGLSSYLMTSEDYTFNYPTTPSYQFKNDSLQNNIFSILQISGGYERAINERTKIRVEPYVKIPLQGIGKGDMPITSFGIYFGITHSFR
jgi:hypothetical protein